MKKFIILMLSLVQLGACSNFLKETSQDLIVPKSVKDYQEFLFGEGYLRGGTSLHTWLDVMTDDVKENISGWSFGSDTRTNAFGYYTWQKSPEETISGGLNNDNAWATYYHSILICNVVLDATGDMAGSEKETSMLKAESHALRAWSYFMLVNLYGEPYDEASASNSLGVPLNNVVGMEDRHFMRESVDVIYEQIESDLTKAIEYFCTYGSGKSIFRWNLPATYLLASRVSLYKKDYDKVIEYANKVIATNPQLYDLSTMSSNDYFINSKNPEILFTYGNYLISYYAVLAKCNFPASNDLIASLGSNDYRMTAFLKKRSSYYTANKSNESGSTGVYGFALRTAEAYLNRAEAYAEKGETDKAMADLKSLRMNRLKVYKDLVAASKEEAIDNVRAERRRELCFEYHRWFDLRRWGRPRIEHTFTRDIKKPETVERYVLEENDKAYTLPLPRSVVESDPLIKDIIRPDRENLNAINE